MKKLLTLSALLLATVVFAQDEPKKLSISGSVDTYYQTYLTAPDNEGQSFGTAFAGKSGFALGMGNVILAYEGEKTGAVLDLVVGPRGAGATFSNDIVDGIVNQAYVYWNVSEKTTLTMGRFNTFLGYEVIAPAANFNYSTSYLFSSGPFSHMGIKADFALSDDFSLMLAVTNPWDTNDISFSGEYALGAQLGFYGQFLNLYYDGDAVDGLGFEIDYTGGFDLSDAFFLGINAAYNDNDGSGFYGAALYPQFTTSDSFAVGLRGEYYGLHGDANPDEESVLGVTLTGSYSIENLILKPEVRLDSWNDSMPYIDNDGAASKSLAAFTLAAIYSF
ncbi:outer membrane beta-barrel protein [Tamlana sp. 2_MG-2023]|uniref:outer membrane beta-barrel protein n=1 Tax=unclassified Tamlana TaxID=2614803 RepID=UPI0026E1E184|nr:MULTISPECIES: outer membrane beta-barrel protein [unclassified Tamlana]MDO6761416.1 outer membrane beta-barrel protein [Tamlana sp. 2_MG-2023]MDO6792140.1 outer membrane beta-barrel protein [Tamlana sp. 1_MG-2023]